MRLIASFLTAALLTGCVSAPVRVERQLPPVNLLADCPIPSINARTNGDLANSAQALRYALEFCNNDKAALREWAKE